MNAIKTPIELRHPVDVFLGNIRLSKRQQSILDKLPAFGDRATFRKREVSMLDLSALTAKTGDEFAMFTLKGKRLVVRGNNSEVQLYENDLIILHNEGYRLSGHTHPGRTDADLIASQGDMDVLKIMNQNNSSIYNALGRRKLIHPKEE